MSVNVFWALLLALRLGLPAPAAAQAPEARQPQSTLQPGGTVAAPPGGLTIFVLDGQNAVNDIRVASMATVVVEVRDENAKPVESADVVFELPATGAGGLFAGQQRQFMTRANLQGQAAATYTPNSQAGRFSIQVTARLGNRSGSTTIPQTNSLRPAKAETAGGARKFRWWKVALIAGAGAAVAGIVLATRGSTPTVTLTPGRPTFGTP